MPPNLLMVFEILFIKETKHTGAIALFTLLAELCDWTEVCKITQILK